MPSRIRLSAQRRLAAVTDELQRLAEVDHTEVDAHEYSVTAFPRPGVALLTVISELAGARRWPVEQHAPGGGAPRRSLPQHHHAGRSCLMDAIRIIAGRELRSYFATPLAYVFIVIFLAHDGRLHFLSGRLL